MLMAVGAVLIGALILGTIVGERVAQHIATRYIPTNTTTEGA